MLRTVHATRYVTPLREGGSLPAIVEADDDGMYVVKFRASGQGPRALIAELLGGEIGRALGLPVPELVLVELDEALGQNEPDTEIRDLVVGSAGLNAGLDYLPGSFGIDPLAIHSFDPALAARIVWFDAFITNVDRTLKNPNILLWHRQPWLIDHGAAFYFHHTWESWEERALSPFPMVHDHVLLGRAGGIMDAGDDSAARLGGHLFAELASAIPNDWLIDAPFADAATTRAAYVRYLEDRLASRRRFEEEAERARAKRG
jgi:hypothetical protein